MRVPLATEGPAERRRCEPPQCKRGGTVVPYSPPHGCPGRLHVRKQGGQQTAGKKQTFKRARMTPLRLNLSCFYTMTTKTIGLQTEGQNIAAKSLLDC